MWRVALLASLALVGGCQVILGLDDTSRAAVDASVSQDAITIADSAVADAPGCGPLGTCGDHCCAVVPSNAASVGRLSHTGYAIELSQSVQFDTSGDCSTPSRLGICAVVARTGAPAICVCRMDSLRIDLGQTLTVRGPAALALLVEGGVVIAGVINVSAVVANSGPGADGRAAGVSGGSFGTAGGSGGHAPAGNAELVPLAGGESGRVGSASDSAGGGGGGALQITAGTTLTVTGIIDAAGGGGRGGFSHTANSGAGGGSGGGILVEAPALTVSSESILSANGGGGGGGASGHDSPGGAGGAGQSCLACTASGGQGSNEVCSDMATHGGTGGAGSAGNVNGFDGQDGDTVTGTACGTISVGVGGGGGAAGVIRVNTIMAIQGLVRSSPTATVGILPVN